MPTEWDFPSCISFGVGSAVPAAGPSLTFTFQRGKVLTEIATKRLNAIREFTKFGSGFRIALRDLEIRGAGNILGTRQHGHMEAVGYDMYLRLLSEAVAEKRGRKARIAGFGRVPCGPPTGVPTFLRTTLTESVSAHRRVSKIASIKNRGRQYGCSG